MSENNRHFYRVPFKTKGILTLSSGRVLELNLKNISLKGVLCDTESLDFDTLEINRIYPLSIHLPASAIEIKTEAELIHLKDRDLGFFFKEIDLDSMIHLRRLLELNIPQEGEIDKEFTFICQNR